MALLTITKGLPLAFNKDMQEDKEPLFDSVDTVLAMLDVFPPMMRTATLNEETMAAAAIADFTLATDAADLLAKNGVPFREAHHVIGELVATCIADGKTFANLTDEEWAAIHPVFAKAKPPVDAWTSVSGRNSIGGTSPEQVERTRTVQRDALDTSRSWVAEQLDREERVFARP
jgi:argininosuccinate lyase